jgi:hypothetical protein
MRRGVERTVGVEVGKVEPVAVLGPRHGLVALGVDEEAVTVPRRKGAKRQTGEK